MYQAKILSKDINTNGLKFDPAYIIDKDGNLKITEISLVHIPEQVEPNMMKLKELSKKYPVEGIPIDWEGYPDES